MLKRSLFFALFLNGAFFSSLASNEKVVNVCSPYNSPPFVINDKLQTGLLYDYLALLNKEIKGFRFQLLTIPRARLTKLLTQENSLECIVPFVSSKWFSKTSNLTWSSVIYTDEQLILSPESIRLAELNEDQVRGMSTARMRGAKFAPIDYLINQKVVTSYTTNSIKNSVDMLFKGRVDFVISSRTFLEYHLQKYKYKHDFYLSSEPLSKFERRVLVPKKLGNVLLKEVNRANSLFSIQFSN